MNLPHPGKFINFSFYCYVRYKSRNGKSEAAENPLPHFNIRIINLVLLQVHASRKMLPHTPLVQREQAQ